MADHANLCCFQSFGLNKGIGKLPEGSTDSKVNWQWKALEEDISFPAALLDLEKVDFNLNWMDEFLDNFETKNKILLAPHGKTTMMPKLFNKVCDPDKRTWGMTVATATQAKTAYEFGISKILMANQLVGKRNMEIISEILEKDAKFEFLCIIDSAENVSMLGNFFSQRNQAINVLLEYGLQNGRTGVRTEDKEKEVLAAIEMASGSVNLVGIEFFEGILQKEDEICGLIDSIILRMKALLTNTNVFKDTFPIILTGSGSAWFDMVAEKLVKFVNENSNFPLQIILRPGCYMIHDIGNYMQTSNRIQAKGLMSCGLKPALKIWGYVQSIPETDLAIVNFGKRDCAEDSGYPQPALHFRPGQMTHPIKLRDEKKKEPNNWHIFRMMDQHSFLRISSNDDDVQVGDLVGFDICHPCTTIDKWRKVLVTDGDYNVVDVYSTYF